MGFNFVKFGSRPSSFKRVSIRIALVALFLIVSIAAFMLLNVHPAKASGCTVPPCGALTNLTTSQIGVKWSDDDGVTWLYGVVQPNTTMGGWWNDGLDIDFWYIPAGCTDSGGIGGTNMSWSGEQWAKISSSQTVVINSRTCPPPQPTATPRPPATPTPGTSCTSPSSWPSTKSWINIWTTAIGRSGTNNACGQVGSSYTGSNPQYVWCRRLGGTVSDSSGNHNHWWLWTDLDTGGRGWISAYYISGQGNDQANDMYTGLPIPNC